MTHVTLQPLSVEINGKKYLVEGLTHQVGKTGSARDSLRGINSEKEYLQMQKEAQNMVNLLQRMKGLPVDWTKLHRLTISFTQKDDKSPAIFEHITCRDSAIGKDITIKFNKEEHTQETINAVTKVSKAITTLAQNLLQKQPETKRPLHGLTKEEQPVPPPKPHKKTETPLTPPEQNCEDPFSELDTDLFRNAVPVNLSGITTTHPIIEEIEDEPPSSTQQSSNVDGVD